MARAPVAGLLVTLLASPASVAQNAQLPAMTAEALAALLQKDGTGFASTNAPWQFTFPRDHGTHRDHRTESWQFSGSVSSRDGRRFGFQVVFFRIAIAPPGAAIGPSQWAARELYWAQFILGDAAADRSYEFERAERAAMGLSGAEPLPGRVWVGDWAMEVGDASGENATFLLRAAAADVRIALTLRSVKPPVIPASGDADRTATGAPDSFYAYMMTRLRTTGRIQIADQMVEVEGDAWLDRAWGLVPLPVGAVVWDRFLLQLADGRELMAVRLRRRDGGGEPITSGMIVSREGAMRMMDEGALSIDLIDDVADPRSRAPRWRVRVPAEGIELRLTPYVSVREMRLSLRSWTGAVAVGGTVDGRAAAGHGYVELAAGRDDVRLQ